MKIFRRAYFWTALAAFLIVGLAAFLLVEEGSVWVASKTNLKQCESDPIFEVRIGACAAVITSEDLDIRHLAFKNLVDAFNRRGIALTDLGDYERAIRYYDRAIRLSPTYADAFVNRGWAYAKLGQYKRAIKDYDQAIRLNPKDADGFLYRGSAYKGLGQYERAIKDFDQALRHNPIDATTFNNRGFAHSSLGNYERAIQDYDHAIMLDPKDHYSYESRGNIYAELGQYERALKDYDEYHLLNPDDLFRPLYRFVAAARIGDEDARTTLVRQTASADLGKWPGVFVRMFLGDIEPKDTLVAAAANKQQTETESLCEAYYFIGAWHLLKGETEMAAVYFQSAVDTGAVDFIEYDLSRAELKRIPSTVPPVSEPVR